VEGRGDRLGGQAMGTGWPSVLADPPSPPSMALRWMAGTSTYAAEAEAVEEVACALLA